LRAESPRSCRAVEPEVRLSRSFALPLYSTPVSPSLSRGSPMLQSSNAANPGDQLKHGLVLVRRDSEFGLLRDIEKRAQILGRSLEGCWGPAPRPPGFIALGHQQVLPNVLAGFERTEAGVAARRQHLCRAKPGTVGFREPVDGISQTLGLLPSRALSS
jgi:hypothetical protein